MKISCIQMDMAFCDPDLNFQRARKLIAKAVEDDPDVILLPETWNTGFFPREDLEALCDQDCERVIREIGSLARFYHVNIIAGSVSNLRNGSVYNTACVFDRDGTLIAQYDKTHLFTPMGEDNSYAKGDHLCTFLLDGRKCGVLICYDIRFPELTRSMTVDGLDFLFVVSQWPEVRIPHLLALTRARAIENQMFVACCNSCGTAAQTRYGGCSAIFDPWGAELAMAGPNEQLLTAQCDPGVIDGIRSSINVFRDRRVELYKL